MIKENDNQQLRSATSNKARVETSISNMVSVGQPAEESLQTQAVTTVRAGPIHSLGRETKDVSHLTLHAVNSSAIIKKGYIHYK